MMPIVRLENVTKIFGDHPRRALEMVRQGTSAKEIFEETGATAAVADVTFEVEQGEILVVMGLSGSGKSTLARCINRLVEPTDGKVFIGDDDVMKYNRKELLHLRRQRIGMVFQNFALFPNRRVVENAEYGLEVMKVKKKERRDRAMEVLELVGLKGWEHRFPSELSGGMQQRVGLARALAVDPDIILMDEALSALDPMIRKDMQAELLKLQRKLNKTILFISHDLEEAINIGDRIVLMKDGRIVQIGTAEEIQTNPASDYVERFVEDMNSAKVLTAGTIMKEPDELVYESDEPRIVLEKINKSDHSALFAVDSSRRLKGIVHAGTAARAVEKEERDRSDLIDSNVRTVSRDTVLREIVPMMAKNLDPVAVVDEGNKLLGVIFVKTLLTSLAEGGIHDAE